MHALPTIDDGLITITFPDERSARAFLAPYERIRRRADGVSVCLPYPEPDCSYARPRVCFEAPWLPEEAVSMVRLTALQSGMLTASRCEVAVGQLAAALGTLRACEPSLFLHPEGSFINTRTGDTHHFVLAAQTPAGLGEPPRRGHHAWLLQQIIRRFLSCNVVGFSPSSWAPDPIRDALLNEVDESAMADVPPRDRQTAAYGIPQASPSARPTTPLTGPLPPGPRVQSSRAPAILLVLLILLTGTAATTWTVLLRDRAASEDVSTTAAAAAAPEEAPTDPDTGAWMGSAEAPEEPQVDEALAVEPSRRSREPKPPRRSSSRAPRIPEAPVQPAAPPEPTEVPEQADVSVIGGEAPSQDDCDGPVVHVTRPGGCKKK